MANNRSSVNIHADTVIYHTPHISSTSTILVVVHNPTLETWSQAKEKGAVCKDAPEPAQHALLVPEDIAVEDDAWCFQIIQENESPVYLHKIHLIQKGRRKKVTTRITLGGESSFFAARYKNQYPRMMQITRLHQGSSYFSNYHPADDFVPVATLTEPAVPLYWSLSVYKHQLQPWGILQRSCWQKPLMLVVLYLLSICLSVLASTLVLLFHGRSSFIRWPWCLLVDRCWR